MSRFYDDPRHQLALAHLDGWGWVEAGCEQRVSGQYEPHYGSVPPTSWPRMAVLWHARVDTFLGRGGRPAILVELLRHRYPRCVDPVAQHQVQHGVHFRNEFDTFVNPTTLFVQTALGCTDWEIRDLLERREKEFIRGIGKWLRTRERTASA